MTVLAVAYCGGLPAFLIAIRHGHHPVRSWAGAWLVFYPLVVTWVCDTAAMFGGRVMGGPKLAPQVSPGKTRSGSVAGVLGGLAVAPLFAAVIFPRVGVTVGLGSLLVIAAVLGVVGQVGDLAESLFKREAGGQGFEPPDSGTRRRARPARLAVLRRPRGGGAVPVLWGDLMRSDTNRTPLGVAVLGSTGSIGRSTLEVLRRQRDHFRVVALTGGRDGRTARGTGGRVAARVRGARGGQRRIPIAYGAGGSGRGGHASRGRTSWSTRWSARPGSMPPLPRSDAGKRVALANKETLVMAGDLVAHAACAGGGELVPVDSEHSAVLQCVTGRESALARLILTCSGGPFREWPAERVRNASVDEALRHPTWAMGNKITVDCATLANKALEVIEAHHLFGLPYDDLEVVIHPQSIVHAFVELCDGSIIAQLGFPSMELPILYALTHPARLPDTGVRRFDPVAAGPLTFEPVRHDVFRALSAGVAAGRAGRHITGGVQRGQRRGGGGVPDRRDPIRPDQRGDRRCARLASHRRSDQP